VDSQDWAAVDLAVQRLVLAHLMVLGFGRPAGAVDG
jgi:hypothetical protein